MLICFSFMYEISKGLRLLPMSCSSRGSGDGHTWEISFERQNRAFGVEQKTAHVKQFHEPTNSSQFVSVQLILAVKMYLWGFHSFTQIHTFNTLSISKESVIKTLDF